MLWSFIFNKRYGTAKLVKPIVSGILTNLFIIESMNNTRTDNGNFIVDGEPATIYLQSDYQGDAGNNFSVDKGTHPLMYARTTTTAPIQQTPTKNDLMSQSLYIIGKTNIGNKVRIYSNELGKSGAPTSTYTSLTQIMTLTGDAEMSWVGTDSRTFNSGCRDNYGIVLDGSTQCWDIEAGKVDATEFFASVMLKCVFLTAEGVIMSGNWDGTHGWYLSIGSNTLTMNYFDTVLNAMDTLSYTFTENDVNRFSSSSEFHQIGVKHLGNTLYLYLNGREVINKNTGDITIPIGATEQGCLGARKINGGDPTHDSFLDCSMDCFMYFSNNITDYVTPLSDEIIENLHLNGQGNCSQGYTYILGEIRKPLLPDFDFHFDDIEYDTDETVSREKLTHADENIQISLEAVVKKD